MTKLFELISDDTVGDIRMVTIRENRYPFLHKIGGWNRDPRKTGDTLVEKWCAFARYLCNETKHLLSFESYAFCRSFGSCHVFDLMRLITQQEACLSQVRALAQRGINYQDEVPTNVAFIAVE